MFNKKKEPETITTETFKMTKWHKFKAKISGISWGDPILDFD